MAERHDALLLEVGQFSTIELPSGTCPKRARVPDLLLALGKILNLPAMTAEEAADTVNYLHDKGAI